MAALLAITAPVLALSSSADADGPGPTWTTLRGAAPTGGSIWNGEASYVPYPGGPDDEVDVVDMGWNFTGTNSIDTTQRSQDGTFRLALGNFAEEDFAISFAMITSMTEGNVAVMSSRATCSGGPFWDVRMVGGGIQFQAYGTDTVPTTLESAPINDGVSHTYSIERVGNTITLAVDGTVVDTQPVQGDGWYTTKAHGVQLAADACVGVGSPPTVPLVGAIDYFRIVQGTDHNGQDLLIEPTTTPTVAAGGSGTIVVNRNNASQSETTSATATINAPDGVTFTDVSDANSTCELISPTEVTCGPTLYGPGTNPATISFTTDASLAPGSVVNLTGTFVNHQNADPDDANNTDVALPIQIADDNGVPIADPTVAAATIGGLGVLGLGGWMLRRRRLTAAG